MSSVNKIVDVTVTKNSQPYRGKVEFSVDGDLCATKKTDADGHATWRMTCSGGENCDKVITVEAGGVSEDKHCRESHDGDELEFELDI